MKAKIRLKQIRKQLSELGDQLPSQFVTVVRKQNQYYEVDKQTDVMTLWVPPKGWRQGKDRLIVFAGSDSGDSTLHLIKPIITVQGKGFLVETVMKWGN